ncbi:MAG: biotin--[acetyl-CoA-carboxylase] ligase [Bacteroidales bacterium]|jgi:BirA family biotin operon repressor/biotin-[acetyl-CoA-carboxylase] ligase|nr:biotin--[acetyl-CoA-carboxylase] ligase [Bacteroidales bacterium]MCU0409612.1 biotin--[acetyl-CoA-carboxylase] ligase [Bacteroidales bacterium]
MIIGSEIISFDSLQSTNSHAAVLLRSSRINEGTIISAGYQSAGRGQAGNTWESEAGMNILMSVILFPYMIAADRQFVITVALSLGIRDFVAGEAKNIKIKWPNDIYAGNDKIAGILIENALSGNSIENCIAGIGLNLNQEKFTPSAGKAISLKNLTGLTYDRTVSVTRLAACLDRRYMQLRTGKTAELEEEYASHLYRLGELSWFSDKGGRFGGIIRGIDKEGRLRVERENRVTDSYYFKEIELIPLSPSSP